MSKPREKLQDELVLEGSKSPILKGEDATRYSSVRVRSACVRLSYVVHHSSDFAESVKHMVQSMREPCESDTTPQKRAVGYLVGKPKAALRFRRHEHVDKITVIVDSDFAGDPVS